MYMLTIDEWYSLFKNKQNSKDLLSKDYGEDYPQLERKRRIILNLLNFYKDKFQNDEKLVLSRIPGRINLMGRHIDHQGGRVNLIAIDREILIIASKRSDQKINAYNSDSHYFPDISFDLSASKEKLGCD
ncbi:MAG: hypothetical protein GF353_01535, partial [Candidatus Lokiarchaeota archaeon]|nr:hypothetical protein [Candidatus Lokiarchaeota archaeon]